MALVAVATIVDAQPVVLRGLAYDSVRNRALGNAFVTLDATRSTSSDASGRFQFDSVPLGDRVIGVQHVALDSLGFSGLSVRVRVSPSMRELRIATRSFASMWSVACRAGEPPTDSGFVYGTVTDATTHAPLVAAVVGLTWLAIDVAKKRNINMQQFAGAGRTNADGGYAICGVPIGVGLRLQASADSVDSGVIEVTPSTSPVLRRDFAIARTVARASPRGGIVVGRVTAAGGEPVANARILIRDDSVELRTDAGGAFIARNVAPGSRQIEAFAIGMSPAAAVVDVVAGDTAHFAVQLAKVQTLDVIRVTSSAPGRRRALEVYERQRAGLGYFHDSSQINPHGITANVFDLFPATQARRLSGTRFRLLMKNGKGESCSALLYLDGALVDQDPWLDTIYPEDIAVVEVYPHGTNVPVEFSSRTARGDPCGAAVIWTKRAFK